MSDKRFDLAIVGAGLNGSLLALAAGEAGLETALIDRVPLKSLTEAGFDGRTTAIAYTSQRLFQAIGVWDDLASRAATSASPTPATMAAPARSSYTSITARPRMTSRTPPRWAGSSRTAFCA